MKYNPINSLATIVVILICSCSHPDNHSREIGAADILGNPDYPAFSFGGYRHNTRDLVPTVGELMEDMKILSAMGVKVIRTYNTSHYSHAGNLLKAIRHLKDADPSFEMYVMLGTWIECEGAWTATPNHQSGNTEKNRIEIKAAVDMANTYPDIVKIIAVGNEAMVQWAVNYFVYPNVILKWVNYLQELKSTGQIPASIWITSSDNYASWGGGSANYRTDHLAELIEAVDFVSLHTYPFHDSHYNPSFWVIPEEEEDLSKSQQIDAAMIRAKEYAISQYESVADYITSLGITKAIHIGETGWSTIASSSYGASGSRAADEYKQKLYFQHMRDWTRESGISCFYFEFFDENWKDKGNPSGSENHFGLINLKGEAKYAIWEMVDKGVFDGLTRNGEPVTKTYDGDETRLLAGILAPPLASEIGILEIITTNKSRKPGETVTEGIYIVVNESIITDGTNDITYPSSILKLNAWEGTCGIEMSKDGVIHVATGTGSWWGCGLEMESGHVGENLSSFREGFLNFEIRGNSASSFNLGFQTGSFVQGDQVNNYVTFGPERERSVTEEWTAYSIAISELDKGADISDVTAPIFFMGEKDFDGKQLYLRNIYYSAKQVNE